MHRYKNMLLIVALMVVLLLSSCSFLDTKKVDMQEADKVAAETLSANAGSYEEYSSSRFAQLHGNNKFILFFHADWCPTCRVLEKRIKEDLGVLNKQVVLEANYDSEVELKKKYEVMIQTTMIFFNEDGSIYDKRVNPSLSFISEFFN